MKSNSPIALLTDFGLRDPFVGIMKGAILGINPSAQIVDICHEISPGDLKAASFALAMAFPYFPKGTIFTAVVDPGVGTARRCLATLIDGKYVVCPDNGILTWVLREHSISESVMLDNLEFFLTNVSETFQGRDIFAPVAAHLSSGTALSDLGTKIEDVMTWPVPEVTTTDTTLTGEVIYIDGFGNLVTNITKTNFYEWGEKPSRDSVKVQLGSTQMCGINKTYGDVALGHTVAVFGSSGRLEVAINGGNMAQALNASIGTHVAVYNLQGRE